MYFGACILKPVFRSLYIASLYIANLYIAGFISSLCIRSPYNEYMGFGGAREKSICGAFTWLNIEVFFTCFPGPVAYSHGDASPRIGLGLESKSFISKGKG